MTDTIHMIREKYNPGDRLTVKKLEDIGVNKKTASVYLWKYSDQNKNRETVMYFTWVRRGVFELV